MPRPSTVRIDETGAIRLPPSLRRQFRAGSRFSVSANNGTIVLKEVTPSKPMTREEALKQFDAASRAIARDFDRRGVTVADIRRTLKKVRAQRRAESGR